MTVQSRMYRRRMCRSYESSPAQVRAVRLSQRRAEDPDDTEPRCCFEACCCDLASSVMSDGAEKVPTGGELTLFEAVGRARA
jgi:hypothetical protein